MHVSSVEVRRSRPVTITVASLIFLINGIFTLVAGFVVFGLLGSLAGAGSKGPGAIIFSILGGLGAVIVLVGVLYLATGYGLWKMQRWAAVLGMLICLIDIMITSFLQGMFPMYSWYYDRLGVEWSYGFFLSSVSSASHWVGILIFILIAISWRAFEEQR